ncbi:hypothetical protein ACFGWO_11595 [Pasteurella multocida]
MKMSILNHSDGSISIEEGDKYQLIENYDLKTGVVLADKKTNHSVIIEFSIDDKGFFRISHNGDSLENWFFSKEKTVEGDDCLNIECPDEVVICRFKKE